jgi:hypothetical protein
MNKILWLSRHNMTQEQKEQLVALFVEENQLVGDAEIVSINATFSADSMSAVAEIHALLKEHDTHLLSGVFPAHIAARLCEQSYRVALPVSVPVFAEDGQQRGFCHSHFEFF